MNLVDFMDFLWYQRVIRRECADENEEMVVMGFLDDMDKLGRFGFPVVSQGHTVLGIDH